MKKRILYPVTLFVVLQAAVVTSITLWVIWYVLEKNDYDNLSRIASRAYSHIEAATYGYAAMVSGVILLAIVFIGATLIFIGWIRERLLYRQRAEFFSAFSHELMTPITCIKMNLEMLQSAATSITPEKKELLFRAAIAESERLELSIKNIIETTRIEHKKLNLLFTNTELSGYIRDFTAGERVSHPEACISFCEPPDPAGIPVDIDPRYFSIALSNLVHNALKYSANEKKIVFSVYRSGKKAEIAVADNGIGMERDKIKKIFGLFYRANNNAASGTGLGLYITKSIITLHGGTIQAESAGPGKGSRFIINLPVRKAPE
ncbi:MAG: hypothetical protein A3K03_04535 [Bdellovibrionales bacterium RIFOXYD1_FULL_44_7]|nr:MAG: hypothetical protein A3K03_04535 [Bdellovibrionales bacterium RIFOXYD1_FULL_44_7]